MGENTTRRPFGVAIITTHAGTRRRIWRTFLTLGDARTFKAERAAAGDEVVHIEQRVDGEWQVIEQAPKRPERSQETHKATRRADRRYLDVLYAVLERDADRCECGNPAVTVTYRHGCRPQIGVIDDPNRLNVDSLQAVCADCQLITPADQSGPYTTQHQRRKDARAASRKPPRESNPATPAAAHGGGSDRPERPDLDGSDERPKRRYRGSRGRGLSQVATYRPAA